MINKVKALEKLVFEACKKLRHLETENHNLRLQSKGLARELERFQHAQTEQRELRHWREDARARLKKLAAKVEKAIEKGGK